MAQELEALLGAAGRDFEAVETALRGRVLTLAARLLERILNADTSDRTGPTRPCPCGAPARYVDRRPKTFTTVLGPLTLARAYYHCATCGQGHCPRDAALGLAETTLSPAVTRMLGVVGALVSFAEGGTLLRDLAGVHVPAKQVERTAETLGRAIAAEEAQVVEAAPPAAPTLYLGVDGTGVPMRAPEVTGRAGKQPDGTAQTREAKVCAVWSAEGRAPDGTPQRDPGSVTYSAAIESAASRDTAVAPSAFAARVVREATRRGFSRAARQVILGDGALWIWNLADEHFPGALQIVDRFHAKAHLSEVAKAVYGPASALGTQWAQRRHGELDAGDLPTLLRALDRHAATHPEAQAAQEYVRRNRARLRYPEFHAAGLSTSTGVLEAGCKVVVATRLKRAGMHWTVRGANAILALRCNYLSSRYEDFWERRRAAPREVA